MNAALTPQMFVQRYSNVLKGTSHWQKINTATGFSYTWQNSSTYIKHPPYFLSMQKAADGLQDIRGARPLAVLGDSITTDHISPAGSIKETSPAAVIWFNMGLLRKISTATARVEATMKLWFGVPLPTSVSKTKC